MVDDWFDGQPFFVYQPDAGYRGTDQPEIAVTVNGFAYLVRFEIRVVQVTVDGTCRGSRVEAGHLTWDSAVQPTGGLDLADWSALAKLPQFVGDVSGVGGCPARTWRQH